MTLQIAPELDAKAEAGEVELEEFVACIKDSLPYAWQVVEGLAEKLYVSGAPFVDNQERPPNADALGQVLRLAASDAMRAAVEQYFEVKVAFQNCNRIALFRKDCSHDTYTEFISFRSQILNQKSWLHYC